MWALRTCAGSCPKKLTFLAVSDAGAIVLLVLVAPRVRAVVPGLRRELMQRIDDTVQTIV